MGGEILYLPQERVLEDNDNAATLHTPVAVCNSKPGPPSSFQQSARPADPPPPVPGENADLGDFDNFVSFGMGFLRLWRSQAMELKIGKKYPATLPRPSCWNAQLRTSGDQTVER